MRPTLPVRFVVLTALACTACDDLKPEGESQDLLDGSAPTGSTWSPDASAPTSFAKEIDAASNQQWVFLDLETGETRTSEEGFSAWDLKLQRFKIATNGGASGSGNVKVSVITSGDYDALRKAPQDGYASDQPDGSDTDEDPDTIFSSGTYNWYEYNGETHALTPKPYIFVVRSHEGAFFKLKIDKYYNAAGSSGYLALRWAQLTAPDGALVERDPNAAVDAGVDGLTSASKM